MKNMHDDDKWDNRELGGSEQFVRKVSKKQEQEIDDLLGLQMITIRLQKDLISQLKLIAQDYGIGYQPLIRQILTHFVKNTRNVDKKKIKGSKAEKY